MSFAITACGTPDQVRAQLNKQHEQLNAHTGEKDQYERVYQAIIGELDDWPAAGADQHPDHQPCLYVEATGHHTTHDRTMSITIKPFWVPKVDA